MGVVYKARHIKLDRIVALKMVLAGAHAGPTELARFQTEAEAVARLQHPNIVQIYEVGEHDGLPFFSLEYVDGGSLQHRMDGTPLPARTAAALVATLARAMDYAHHRGIVHRDLKPANILLVSSGAVSGESSDTMHDSPITTYQPKITDFGLAKRVEQDSRQTGTGSILGTPSYMAPEQALGQNRNVGPAADIYALGAILYDLITGRPPFKGETVLDTLQQVQSSDPLPPRQLQPKLPRDLETICLKCLEKEASKRYASAGELAEDLQCFVDHKPIKARPSPWWEHALKWARRRPAVAALLASLAVTIVVAFLGMLLLWLNAVGERQAAEDARDQTELQRLAALRARDEADKQRDRADKNLEKAFAAGDALLTRVSQEKLLQVPRMELVRKDLLLKAKTFFESFTATEGSTPAIRFQTALANQRVGTIEELLGQYDASHWSFARATDLLEGLLKEEPTRREYRMALANTRSKHGVVQQARKQAGAADSEFKQAIALYDGLRTDFPLDDNHRSNLAETWQRLAILCWQYPSMGDADSAFKRALEIRERLYKEYGDRDYTFKFAVGLNDYGAKLLTGPRQKEATDIFNQALELAESLTTLWPETPSYIHLRAAVLKNIAVSCQTQDPARAKKIDREVAGILEKLVDDFPNTIDYRHDLADVLTNLSLLLAAKPGGQDAAAKERGDALPHWRRLVQDAPQRAEFYDGLAGSLVKDAEYRWGKNERKQGLALMEEALTCRLDQVARFPEPKYQLELAKVRNNVGQMSGEQGNTAREEEQYQLAIKLLEKGAASMQPIPADWNQVMADVSRNQSFLWLYERKDLETGVPFLRKAIAYQRAALVAGMKEPRATTQLINVLMMLVDVSVQRDEFAEASQAARDVEPLLRDQKGLKGNELYHMARLMARCLPKVEGAQNKAFSNQVVHLLEAAVAQGYRDADGLRDALFQPLKGRDDYNKLLRDVDKK
jgi:serine/threonine-protein kinase